MRMAPVLPRLSADPIGEAHRQWVAHGWGEAAEGMAAVTSLMRAHQLLLARIETVLRPFEVSFARYEVLMLLLFSKRGSLPMRIVGSRLQVHQTSVTNAVDRLESAGLVRRKPHPTDRRATLVELTPAGRTLAENATSQLNSVIFTDLGIGSKSTEHLIEAIDELRHNSGDY